MWSWYTRLSHFLNSDGKTFWQVATASLFRTWDNKMPPLEKGKPRFLGFWRKTQQYTHTQTHTAGFEVWLNWPKLHNLCLRTTLTLNHVRDNMIHCDTEHQLTSAHTLLVDKMQTGLNSLLLIILFLTRTNAVNQDLIFRTRLQI